MNDLRLAAALLAALGMTAHHARAHAEPSPARAAHPPPAPLSRVADFPLPGRATRFDYQDVDPRSGHLIVAHMNDAEVLVVDRRDGTVVRRIPDIPTARGVVVADDAHTIFVTSSPNRLVLIDSGSLKITGRVATGDAPDGVAWDPTHRMVGVSDQGDGALSLIADGGRGARTQVPLGKETGNVVFDAGRGWFWITVVATTPPDRLIAVDPKPATVVARVELPGCAGAHGLRMHPDGQTALIACEDNDKVARVGLGTPHTLALASTGHGPDVLSVDAGLGRLYVAAEHGDVVVFDLNRPGLTQLGSVRVGDHAHSVAVDPQTHDTYFPLMKGPAGTPILRVMSAAQ